MSDLFEDAADAVTKKQGSDETAEVFYEKRKYPLIPEGVYPAMCIRAEIKEANPNGKFYQQGDKVIALTWEVKEPTYKGDDEEQHKYLIFNKPISIGFGERTNLRKLFLKLTGFDLAGKENPMVQRIQKKLDLGNGKFREGTVLRFNQKVLEYMEANLDVEHQEWEDQNGEMRKSAYIVNYKVTPEMKKKNFDQLPPEARTQAMSTEEVDLESPQSQQEQVQETGVQFSGDKESTLGKLEQEQKAKMENDPGMRDFMEKTDTTK